MRKKATKAKGVVVFTALHAQNELSPSSDSSWGVFAFQIDARGSEIQLFFSQHYRMREWNEINIIQSLVQPSTTHPSHPSADRSNCSNPNDQVFRWTLISWNLIIILIESNLNIPTGLFTELIFTPYSEYYIYINTASQSSGLFTLLIRSVYM